MTDQSANFQAKQNLPYLHMPCCPLSHDNAIVLIFEEFSGLRREGTPKRLSHQHKLR